MGEGGVFLWGGIYNPFAKGGWGGVTSAKTDDAQAGYEGAHATLSAILGGANLIMHSAGWLESGRCTDMQKFNRESAFLETILE